MTEAVVRRRAAPDPLVVAAGMPRGSVEVVLIGDRRPMACRQIGMGYEVSVATTYWGTLPELHEVLSLARSGMITPHVTRFGLDEAPSVYERLSVRL